MSQNKTIVLIDYENIHHIDLAIVQNQQIDIKIFVGKSQSKVPIDLVQVTQKLGEKVEWIKIEGAGSNALDFHIAFYLGQLSHINGISFVILSKDKGYDPLIKHINKINIKCKRIESLSALLKSESSKSQSIPSEPSQSQAAKSQAAKSQAAKSQAAKSQAAKSQATKSQAAKSQAAKSQAAKSQDRPICENQELVTKVFQNLSKIEKSKRPKTCKSLHQHIKSLLPQGHRSSHTVDSLINTLFVQGKISEVNNKLSYNF